MPKLKAALDTKLPDALSDWIVSLTMSPMLILICILLAFAVLAMFMDAIGTSGPMCAIWCCISVVKMAEFRLNNSPIVLNGFVAVGAREDLSVQDVFRGITIALLVAFSVIVLWLPNLS